SGNSPGGSQPGQGALAPAIWYAGPPNTLGLVQASQDPVVWAVGAVDRADRPLARAPSGSLPPIVSHGAHAIAPRPAGTWPDPLTGSSVSAAVASSIAAIVWNLRPQLSADRIMALVMSSGRELPLHAALYRQSTQTSVPPPIRRLW